MKLFAEEDDFQSSNRLPLYTITEVDIIMIRSCHQPHLLHSLNGKAEPNFVTSQIEDQAQPCGYDMDYMRPVCGKITGTGMLMMNHISICMSGIDA